MNYNIILKILGEKWLVNPIYAAEIGPSLREMIINGKSFYTGDEKQTISIPSADGINVVPILGPLTKSDTECGAIGMKTMTNMITRAEENNDIKGHILIIDSPGGTVDGTMELAKAIADTKKPIVALIDNQAASAAYWIASQTDYIYALTDFTEVGSIGVMLSFADMREYWTKQGVKMVTINSTLSPDKNIVVQELLEGNFENYQKNVLDPIAKEFQSKVSSKRPVSADQMTGKVFFAKDVIGSMIDEIGTFNDAVEYIEKKYNNNNNNNKKMADEKRPVGLFSFASKIFGKKIETDADLIEAQTEQLEQIAAQLAEANESKQKIVLQNEELAQKLTEAQKKIDELEAENAELKKAPATQKTTAVKDTDGQANDEITLKEGDFFHNLLAVKNKYFKQ